MTDKQYLHIDPGTGKLQSIYKILPEPYQVHDTHWMWLVMATSPEQAIKIVQEGCPDCGGQCEAQPLREILAATHKNILQTEGIGPIVDL